MLDFNFFLPFIGEKKESRTRRLLIYGIIASVGLLLTSSFLFNLYRIYNLNKDITVLDNALNDKALLEKQKEAEEVTKKLDILNKYYNGVSIISKQINSLDSVSSSKLNDIANTLPKDTYFKSMSFSNKSIEIQGGAKSKVSIAELQHNLRKIDYIEDVQVSNVSLEEKTSDYSFSLKCTLKDVDKNGSD